ncbi:MAG: hypothetical protein K1X82_07105 [Bacteroidia bacterium]|nr:hypothetical protein [Bacteroidia bacterium]
MENKPKTPITNLESLQRRKAELAVLCKEKEMQIGLQVDHISDNLGPIAIQSLTGYQWNKEGSAKAEIVKLLVSEGVDTAILIQSDPTNIKEKLVELIKRIAAGIINILTK